MSAQRTPFEDTSVPVSRSQEGIREMLRRAGARAVQFEDTWVAAVDEIGAEPAYHQVRFVMPTGDVDDASGTITLARVRIRVKALPDEYRGRVKTVEQRERQAWRGLFHYLKGTMDAAEFGLLRYEDIFLSFIEDDTGRTIGEVLIPQIEHGRLALPERS